MPAADDIKKYRYGALAGHPTRSRKPWLPPDRERLAWSTRQSKLDVILRRTDARYRGYGASAAGQDWQRAR